MVRIGLQPGSDAAAQLPSEDGVQGESIEGERKDNAAGGKGCREIRYKVGTAERLGEAGVGDGEEGVDLVIAGMSPLFTYLTAIDLASLQARILTEEMLFGVRARTKRQEVEGRSSIHKSNGVGPQLTLHRPSGALV